MSAASTLSTGRTDSALQKYANTAHPSTAFANACQLAINHVEYSLRVNARLHLGISEMSSKLYTPNNSIPWTQDVQVACKMLEGELHQSIRVAVSLRKMVSLRPFKGSYRIWHQLC